MAGSFPMNGPDAWIFTVGPVLVLVFMAWIAYRLSTRDARRARERLRDRLRVTPVFVELVPVGRPERQLRWELIQEVIVRTGRSRSAADASYEIRGAGTRLSFPCDIEGHQALLDALRDRLNGFDVAAVTEAIGYGSEAVFCCWKRDAVRPASPRPKKRDKKRKRR